MMLEYVEVILLRLWVMLKDRESGSPFRNGKVGHALRSLALFGAACLAIVWERLPSPPAAVPDSTSGLEYGWVGSVDAGGTGMENETVASDSAQEVAAPIFDFDARSAGEFASGMFMLLMASAISAGWHLLLFSLSLVLSHSLSPSPSLCPSAPFLFSRATRLMKHIPAARKVQAESVARAIGGPKRLFALSAPISAIGLLPFVLYAHSADSKGSSSLAFLSEWSVLHQLGHLGACMFVPCLPAGLIFEF